MPAYQGVLFVAVMASDDIDPVPQHAATSPLSHFVPLQTHSADIRSELSKDVTAPFQACMENPSLPRCVVISSSTDSDNECLPHSLVPTTTSSQPFSRRPKGNTFTDELPPSGLVTRTSEYELGIPGMNTSTNSIGSGQPSKLDVPECDDLVLQPELPPEAALQSSHESSTPSPVLFTLFGNGTTKKAEATHFRTNELKGVVKRFRKFCAMCDILIAGPLLGNPRASVLSSGLIY